MVATGLRAESSAQVPPKKRTVGFVVPEDEQDSLSGIAPAPAPWRAAGASPVDNGIKTLRKISVQVQSLTREIIAAEQEADKHTRKCGQFSAAEQAWRSLVSQQAPEEMCTKIEDMKDRLLAAQQGYNDTSLAEEAEALRWREVADQVRGELEASELQEAAVAQECGDLRDELREAKRAAAVEKATASKQQSRASAAARGACEANVCGGTASGDAAAGVRVAKDGGAVAAQKARSQALLELAAARSEATAAHAELASSKEALSKARQSRDCELKAAHKGFAEKERKTEAEVCKGPASACLKAADALYLESCQRSEELLNKVTTWRGLCASSRARAEAAEGKVRRAAQKQAVAEQKAAEEEQQVEAAKPRLAEALERKESAQEAVEVARFWRRAASAALVLSLSLATACAVTLVAPLRA